MIRQSIKGTRNITDSYFEMEKKHIDMLNQALGDIELSKAEEQSLCWLAGWETGTVQNVINVFFKASKRLWNKQNVHSVANNKCK